MGDTANPMENHAKILAVTGKGVWKNLHDRHVRALIIHFGSEAYLCNRVQKLKQSCLVRRVR